MPPACELCGGDRFDDWVVAYDRVVARRNDFLYQRCRSCSLVALAVHPETAASAYPADYPPHAAASDPRTPRRRSRGGRHLVRPRGSGRMLDVGCGSGGWLVRHRELGWRVSGIEPNPQAAKRCREQGLEVQAAELAEASLPEAHFDLIWLHHVIEHVPTPVEALRRIRGALAPGGVAVVVTPNVRSLGFRLYGSCWYAIDAPRHLRLFDARTLSALAARAGLAALETRTEASARVLASSRHYYRSQGPVLPPGLAARAAILQRSREPDGQTPAFRRAMRPLAWGAARLGWGESLRASLVASEPA